MVDILVNKSMVSKFCALLNSVLSKIVERSDINSSSIYDTNEFAHVSLGNYMKICTKIMDIQPSVLIYSFCLLDKILQRGVVLTVKNKHRLFFIALVLSIKMNHDSSFKDKDLASVGKLSIDSFLYLEASFLKTLNFKVYISTELFDRYRKAIIKS